MARPLYFDFNNHWRAWPWTRVGSLYVIAAVPWELLAGGYLLSVLPGLRAISFSLKEEIYFYSLHFMIKIRLYIPSLATMICIFFLNLLKASCRLSPKNFSIHFPKKNVLQNNIINTPKKILKNFCLLILVCATRDQTLNWATQPELKNTFFFS